MILTVKLQLPLHVSQTAMDSEITLLLSIFMSITALGEIYKEIQKHLLTKTTALAIWCT